LHVRCCVEACAERGVSPIDPRSCWWARPLPWRPPSPKPPRAHRPDHHGAPALRRLSPADS
jgi:hypothetical protein